MAEVQRSDRAAVSLVARGGPAFGAVPPAAVIMARPPRAASYWPDSDQELVLRAALLPGEAAADAWRRLRSRMSGDRLIGLAWELRPLLYANLQPLGIRDPLLDAFKATHHYTWSQNQRRLHHTHRLLAGLRDAGINSLLLKGAALALRYYRDPGPRPMGDVDILVPADLAQPAAQTLRRCGWEPQHAVTPVFIAVKHAGPFVDEDGCNCDLHWRVFEEYCPPEADEEFWRAALAIAVKDVPTRALTPADQLLHVCVHGMKWSPARPIRWVADAWFVLRSGGVDWERLAEQAAARRFTLRVRDALRYLRDRLGASVPDEAMARLAAGRVSPLERLEYRLKSRQHRVLGELPLYWCNYLRSLGDRPSRTGPGFAGYLRQAWGLRSLAQLPGAALGRAGRRVGLALRRIAL